MAFIAAALACAGLVRSTCLFRISSSVSTSSSSAISCTYDGVWVGFCYSCCVVGASVVSGELIPVTCNCFKNLAHLVAPSISSKLRNLFLKFSRDRNCEWIDGVRSFSIHSPFMLDLWLAPIAAWSYFSTPLINSFSAFISFVWAGGVVAAAASYVEVSFNWFTMLSTSSRRLSIVLIYFKLSFRVSSAWVDFRDEVDLVARWLVISSYYALSSIVAILPTRS